MAQPPPSAEVLRAFGIAEGPLLPLRGGISQTAFRVGDAVLKFAQDPAENEWSAAVFSAIEEDGFRVHRPIPSRDGSFLVDNWLAWHWVEGEHEKRRWNDVVEAARALHRAIPNAAARAGRENRPGWLATRTHRWAIAEGVVWHGDPLPVAAIYDVPEWSLYERAVDVGPPLTFHEESESQVIHGDVAQNVLSHGDAPLAFIDMSPGWRPPSSVDAQIVVEAIGLQGGADEALLDGVARADAARACAFRLLCGFQSLSIAPGLILPRDEVARFTRVLDLIGA